MKPRLGSWRNQLYQSKSNIVTALGHIETENLYTICSLKTANHTKWIAFLNSTDIVELYSVE